MRIDFCSYYILTLKTSNKLYINYFFAENLDEYSGPHVIILSFPKYCRYRAMMKRLEGVEDVFLKFKVVNALGGFYVKYPNTRVLFCKEAFDYPELEGHELLCNHLAPKLKGRPRGKRKKRSVSRTSESNDSESSVNNNYKPKVKIIFMRDISFIAELKKNTYFQNYSL